MPLGPGGLPTGGTGPVFGGGQNNENNNQGTPAYTTPSGQVFGGGGNSVTGVTPQGGSSGGSSGGNISGGGTPQQNNLQAFEQAPSGNQQQQILNNPLLNQIGQGNKPLEQAQLAAAAQADTSAYAAAALGLGTSRLPEFESATGKSLAKDYAVAPYAYTSLLGKAQGGGGNVTIPSLGNFTFLKPAMSVATIEAPLTVLSPSNTITTPSTQGNYLLYSLPRGFQRDLSPKVYPQYVGGASYVPSPTNPVTGGLPMSNLQRLNQATSGYEDFITTNVKKFYAENPFAKTATEQAVRASSPTGFLVSNIVAANAPALISEVGRQGVGILRITQLPYQAPGTYSYTALGGKDKDVFSQVKTRDIAETQQVGVELGTAALSVGAFELGGRFVGVKLLGTPLADTSVQSGVVQVQGIAPRATTKLVISETGQINALLTPEKNIVSTGSASLKGDLVTSVGGKPISGFNVPVEGTAYYKGISIPSGMLPKSIPSATSAVEFEVTGNIRAYGMGSNIELTPSSTGFGVKFYKPMEIRATQQVVLGKGGVLPELGGRAFPTYAYQEGTGVTKNFVSIQMAKIGEQELPFVSAAGSTRRVGGSVVTDFVSGGKLGNELSAVSGRTITSEGMSATTSTSPLGQRGVKIYGNLLSEQGRIESQFKMFVPETKGGVNMLQGFGGDGGSVEMYKQAYQQGYKIGTETRYVTKMVPSMKSISFGMEVPVRSSINIPTQIPVQIPVQIPKQVAVQIPTQVPIQTPVQIPTQIPTQIPIQIPTQVPFQIPTQVPTQVPKQVPFQVPTQVPTQVPKQVPFQIPIQVPTQIPFQVPFQPPNFKFPPKPQIIWIGSPFSPNMSGSVSIPQLGKREKSKYQPSFIATQLNIKAPKGKALKTEGFGFAVRPIISNRKGKRK